MTRWISGAIAALALMACDDGTRSKISETGERVAKRADKELDKLDTGEAGNHLAAAKQAVAAGTEPHEACSYAARTTPTEATKATLDELRTVCDRDVPLGRATKAVVAAEQAKAAQPQAPSLTECSSDDWAAMKAKLDGGAHAAYPAWADLKARWTKVCP